MTSITDPQAPESKRAKKSYEHTRDSFMGAYNILKQDLLTDELLDKPPAFSQEWFSEASVTHGTFSCETNHSLFQMLDYNVPGGKLNRGMAVYDVLSAIKGNDLSEGDIFKANALGWCIEWLQAFFLVADDIMDGSITRRGQPCWYMQEKVGLIACNDYILLECCIYRIIKKYFAGHPAYIEITDLFHDVTYQTSHGQLLDTVTAATAKTDFVSQYTIDNYMKIVTYKTAFYTFYLPVACGMHLAGIKDLSSFKVAEKILLEMGQYFQIQDDYLDCYGSPEVIGKIGTDIEDNKCSWLICTVLKLASKEQLEVIKSNYGKKDEESVAAIKKVFAEVNVQEKFQEYETESFERLNAAIEAQTALPKPVFTSLLNKIYKRSK